MVTKNWVVLFFCVCLVLFSGLNAAAQQSGPAVSPQGDIEELRQQFQEQKKEIEKLREEIRSEAEQRMKQQKLLEALLARLEKNDPAGAVDTAKTDAPVAPVAAVSPADPSGPKSNDPGAKKDPSYSPQASTPKPVESGFGKVKFTGLIQGWFTAGDRGFNDTFRIRRADMKFTGDLIPKVKWTLMIDPAKVLSLNTESDSVGGLPVVRRVSVNQAGRILQEAYITLSHFKHANINFGQFKLPVSQEALQSSADLDTVERALFLTDRSRGGVLADVRDLGIMAFGPLGGGVEYQLGVFNGYGESQNDVDQNEQKIVAGRLVFRPSFIKGLQIGGSGASATGSSASTPRRDRLGAELVYQRGKFRVKSELMTGVDGEIHRRGYYAHVGYRFHPKVEGIFRFDMLDPDIRREFSAATVTERDYIGGINYFIKDNNLKLQFNYVRKTFANGITPSRNLFLVNLQTSW